jgi:lysozyme family protein
MNENAFESTCYVIRNEIRGFEATGGYRNDPDDPGGETKYGIAKRDHPTVDIASLTMDGATVILDSEYWAYDGLEDIRLAAKLMDLAVNMEGTGKCGAAIRAAQSAVLFQFPEALAVDGVYGPETEKLMNACNQTSLLMALDAMACEHYRAIVAARPASQKFLNGWLARANRIPEYNPVALRGRKLSIAAGSEAA